MSAWDIAGAVVWSALTAFAIHALFNPRTNEPGRFICLMFGTPCMAGAAFCIARLLGGHL